MKKRLNGIKYFVEKEIFSFNFVYLKCYWPLNNYSDLAHKTMHGY